MRMNHVLPLVTLMSLAGFLREAQSDEPWTVDSVVLQERASGWVLSDDGERALWLKATPDKEKDRHLSTLMLSDLATGDHRALTVGKSSVSSAAFSPDGTRVTYLSSRALPEGVKGPKKDQTGSQLWVLDLRGGEARPITTLPYGVGGYQWQGDDTVFLTARDRPTRHEAQAAKDKDDSFVVEDDERFFDASRRLMRLTVSTKELLQVTNNVDRMTSFTVSPDGRYAVAIHAQNPSYGAEGIDPPRAVLHDLETGEGREFFADRANRPSGFAWRRDSKGFFAFLPQSTIDGQDSGAISRVFEIPVADLQPFSIPLDHTRGARRLLHATDDGFVVGLADGVHPRVARFTRSGDAASGGNYSKTLIPSPQDGAIHSLVASAQSDRVIYISGSASDPDHVYSGRLGVAEITESKELYRPNDGFSKHTIARTEIVRWTGALDEEVEGILYYPHDYAAEGVEDKARPLVLVTHGGPHGADTDRFSERWSNTPNLYAQRGAFVLKTNYHGSSDYGLQFGESIKAKYYELELIDMFAGIQRLIDRGFADKDRLGLVGWSNGAILSIAALTHADLYAPEYDFQFRACAPGAGDVNWTSDYGNCAFGATFDEFYLGGTPWNNLEKYLEKSPLFQVEKVTTPTIIFFGTKDTAVPTEQGWEWYRALHRVGKAPVRFVLFPNQPHGLGKLTHQRRKLTEELAWFDRYLFETQSDANDRDKLLVKDGSPLQLAEASSGFARSRGRLGVAQGDLLIPETIPFDDVEIGRFEVTRAQWASFANTQNNRRRANHPITGVTAEEAHAYVDWLSEKTGETWRLPTTKEWEKLKSAAGPSENTLDHWAGYAPATSEMPVLQEKVRALGAFVRIWRAGVAPPGKIKKDGVTNFIFDVGGNVTEWTVDSQVAASGEKAAGEKAAGEQAAGEKSRKTVRRGGCAILSPDPTKPAADPGPDFTGLRIVRERS